MNDVRFALRQLAKSPGFTGIAVLTIALGIGANTAIFSVLNTVMFRALPYPNPDQLVRLFRTSAQSQNWPHSVANFLEYRDANSVFESVAAFVVSRASMADPGEPAESVRAIAATPEIFTVLGVQPALGRAFAAEEVQAGQPPLVVLTHGFWQRRFAADPGVIGRVIRINGEAAEVIGIMPESAEATQVWGPIDLWRPLAFTPEQQRDRKENWLEVLARLKPDVTLAQGNAAVKALGSRLATAYPDANADTNLRLVRWQDTIGDDASRHFSWMTLGLTTFVLLIACVNLANLQLARAAARSKEMAVRLALGVRRWRLIQQLLCESMLLALIGGVLGVALAIWLSGWIGRQVNHPFYPRGIDVVVDTRVLLYGLVSAVLTGTLFGIGPAWLASRTDLNEVLRCGARGSGITRSQQRLRHALIVGEVAIALVLLTGAGLFVRGLNEFVRRDPGWRVDGLLTGSLALTSPKYRSAEQRALFLQQLEQRLASLPGVEFAALSSSVPIWSFARSQPFQIEGQPSPRAGHQPLMYVETVTPDYFKALQIQLREGRVFTPADTTNQAQVTIVNESMARHFWPGQSAIGKRIGGVDPAHPDWREVIGVVGDLRFPGNLNRPESRWQTYRPLAQTTREYVSLLLRTTMPPERAAPALRQIVAELDPDLPVNDLESARSRVNRLLSHCTVAGKTLSAFAVLSLALAGLGIYGVISCFVAQRTSEIGIRMALGAQRRDVLWSVLRKGVLLCSVGLALGMGGAATIVSLLAAAVPEVPTRDTLAMTQIVLILLVVALFACWFPARRAAKLQPLQALRWE